MTLLQIDAADPGAPARAAAAAARAPQDAPVVVMIHGYRYAPGRRGRCPSESLFAPQGGWPAALRLVGAGDGLAIGLGWNACGSIWTSWRAAEAAGAALARILAALPDRRVDLIGHSLGARVALRATALVPAGRVGRMILIAAAAFQGEAQAVLATPGGAAAEVVNVIARSNDLFDLALAACLRSRQGAPLGAGLGEIRRNWIDLEIDDPEARGALAVLGHPVAAPDRVVCHWAGYLRPGLLPFYAALIRDRGALPLPLIAGLLPDPRRRAGRPARRERPPRQALPG